MQSQVRRVVCLGEAMVELASHHGRWDVHYGGDTLNVALHLTRLGHNVAYMTALGGDPFAGTMRAAWAREGMDTSLVLSVPERCTGLYCIDTDQNGERTFSYWRSDSAARTLFHAPGIDRAMDAALQAELLFFSLISLAILPEEGRQWLLDLAAEVRKLGGKVAFDGNYRPRLWESPDTARHWHDRAIALADFGLPSLEDEELLGAPGDASCVREFWMEMGCREVVTKMGAAGAMLPDGKVLAPPTHLLPLDTSGAGDAFDAGYLAARLRGVSPEKAAADGQQLAGWTVMRQGAIPQRDHAAPYVAMRAEAGAV